MKWQEKCKKLEQSVSHEKKDRNAKLNSFNHFQLFITIYSYIMFVWNEIANRWNEKRIVWTG